MGLYPTTLWGLFRTLWAYFKVFMLEVCFQKLEMLHLGSLEATGAPATGLTVIVTGPTSGIGTETARAFVLRGANVVLACRSAERGEALRNLLLAEAAASGLASAQVEVRLLDVSLMKSVRAFAQQWQADGRPLHILVNNAGIYNLASASLELTEEGLESHMATNHLGPLLLSLLLLPALQRGAASGNFSARIVQVSSSVHTLVRGVDLRDPHLQRQPFGGLLLANIAYSQSKLAQMMCMREMRMRLAARPGNKVEVLGVHPGMVLTEVVRTLPPILQRAYRVLFGMILLTPAQGSRASLYAATAPSAPAEVAATGGYMDANCRPKLPSVEARDSAACSAVWQWSMDALNMPHELDLPGTSSSW